MPPDSIIIDNVDSGFQVFGTWSTQDTAGGGGKWGANYRYASPNQAAADSVITDNDSANAAPTGAWSTSTASGRYGANFRYAGAGTGANTFTWTPSIPSAEPYNIYAWWRADTGRASNAPFTIHHDGGSTTVTVDQTVNGSKWNLLGTFGLTPGQNHRIVLSDDANGLTIADAIMITPVDGLNRAVWTPSLPAAASYNLYAWWRQSSSYNAAATFAIHHDGGRSTVVMNQETNGGQWNHLGAFAMTPGQNHRIELTDQSTAPDVVIADAVRIAAVDAPPPTATWTPSLPRRDRYQVYARWEGTTAGYATNAPYTVFHEGGSTTVTVNQQVNDSTWMLLGAFTMAPGQNHRVELTDVANGESKWGRSGLIRVTEIRSPEFAHAAGRAMARLGRYLLADQPLHVIQRGNDRQAIFFHADDYACYRRLLAEASRHHGCAIHAYVLMTNHIHLLLTPGTADGPSRLMQWLGVRYVRHVNTTYRRTGTLWEGRFRAAPIESESHLLACHRYIELNPVRAGMVAGPADYPRSSYRAHAEGAADPVVTDHTLYAALGATAAERQAAYRALFREALDEAWIAELRAATNGGWALGSDRFKAQIAAAAGRRAAPLPKGRPADENETEDVDQLSLL